jgi:GNAT superfamily N-acetyltransferase
MSEILLELSAAALVAALEGNLAELVLSYGRAPGAEVHQEHGLTWVRTGIQSGFHNAAVRTHLAADDGEEQVADTVEAYRSRRVPMLWWITPSTQPTDLGAVLAAQGLTYRGTGPGMAADMDALPDNIQAPAGLRIEEVADAAMLDVWLRTNVEGSTGVPQAADVGELALETSLGFGRDLPYRRYLGRLEGRPVATSTLFLGAGVAGLYGVATLVSARGQGIGAALSLAPLRVARRLGYRAGVLLASPLGRPVYERLGFRQCCPIAYRGRWPHSAC